MAKNLGRKKQYKIKKYYDNIVAKIMDVLGPYYKLHAMAGERVPTIDWEVCCCHCRLSLGDFTAIL